MDKRMVEFIRALRAAGVRISVSETQDAMYGIDLMGISDMALFRNALRTTLVKENRDRSKFEEFFPLFFSSNQPPMEDIMDQLTEEQQQMLQQAMEAMMGDMDALKELMERLLNGEPLTEDELAQLGDMAGLMNGDEMYQRGWFERRMMRQLGMGQLNRMLDELMEELAAMGMSDDELNALEEMLRENMAALAEQISNFAGVNIAERMAEKKPEPKPDLLDVPFNRLGDGDIDAIRDEVRRLAARLRSRNAMRQKKAKAGTFDPRKTMRQNMKYGGTPIEMKFKKRQKKPSLVLICDLSTSMRYMVEFLMTMVYELHDQVQRTHSYIFISDMVDVTMELEQHDSQIAVEKVLRDNPPGYYSTDLGNSLNTFEKNWMNNIDHRTTVIFLGDGRNNYNNPRIDITDDMRRKAHRLFWFCPEPTSMWGSGDSDMHQYADSADGVFLVRNLRHLANAVDKILADV